MGRPDEKPKAQTTGLRPQSVERMARKKWTILVVADEQTAVRQFKLTREMVRGAIAAALILFSVAVSTTTSVFLKLRGPRETTKLARENAELRHQLTDLNGQVKALTAAVEDLSQNDKHFRLVAGLDPLDEGVLHAGIGGPDAGDNATALADLNPSVGAEAKAIARDVSTLLRRARVLSASWAEARDTLAMHFDRLASTPSILPTDGRISSSFTRSRFHPILNRARPHEGIDVTAPRGTPILAAAKGRVKFAGFNNEYGQMVEIDHGYGYVTRYAHASKLDVRKGQIVQRGDTIARVGDTGLAIGPHLHYEVLVNGRPANPNAFVMQLSAIPD